jgi:hypothetical protein
VSSAELWQLTIDGGEVPAFGDETGRHAPLSRRQRGIVVHLREHGTIDTIDAGRIMHAGRDGGVCPIARLTGEYAGEGCCRYCSSDGAAALVRLARRGIVQRVAVGDWRPIVRPA